MVSTLGYTLSEYVFMIGLSYALLLLVILVQCVIAVLHDGKWWNPVIIYGIIYVVIYIMYNMKVRFGVVMFVNGMLAMKLVDGIREVVRDGVEG